MYSSFIIGQIISVIALIISVVIVQFKEVKHILLGEIASNLSVALSFLFLGGMSGAWICIVAAVQSVIIYFLNKYNASNVIRNILTGVFALVYIAGTMLVYQSWIDIISCVCAMLYLMAILQKDGARYRWYMTANSLLWVIYDVMTLAFVNVITHGMLLVSLVIAMLRLDRKKTKTE